MVKKKISCLNDWELVSFDNILLYMLRRRKLFGLVLFNYSCQYGLVEAIYGLATYKCKSKIQITKTII